MPTYEYLCRACGERLEVVQSFSDAALTTCAACGGELRKVFSAAGLIFKGSGWHVKDYSSSSSSSSASPSSPGASASSSKDASSKDAGGSTSPSSDSKPAPTSTPAPAAASSTGD